MSNMNNHESLLSRSLLNALTLKNDINLHRDLEDTPHDLLLMSSAMKSNSVTEELRVVFFLMAT